ncbi:MAG: formyltetrahydrofolate deformylase [Polyangiaceae bacterium]|nr:formyltetrahydrofolate deformylase [Polyangiaceae bacterium]
MPSSSTASDRAQRATLLVSCPDQRGIVSALAQVLAGHGANILSADQHTDAASASFFQRIHFDINTLHTDRLTLEGGIAEVRERFSMELSLHYGEHTKRIAIFVSKYDHCLYDLLLRVNSAELHCRIPLIVSNHTDLSAIAEHFDIPYHHIPITPENKAEQEGKTLALLKDSQIDVVVLARYMQILTPDFLREYPDRVINVHHSFLPAFAGKKPYHQAHERGVKLIGASAHYATADLDEGPIIAQEVAHTSHRDAVEDLIRKGRDLERLVLSRAVRAHTEDRVLVAHNKTVVFD